MISLIIPFYNEKESLPILLEKLAVVFKKNQLEAEIILVDDGSTDGNSKQFQNSYVQIKIIVHRKRMGKGRALSDGVKAASGEIIVFMDADLQDDPEELPKFIEKINSGYDLVNGWRKTRHDNFTKTLPSSIFNKLILKSFFRSKFHDINCGYKSVRKAVFDEIILYGDNYRFLPIIAEQEGFKTTEIEIRHQKRRFGKSKYGFWRLFFGFIDTITTYFVYRFSEKPLHFFAPVGSVLFIIGFIISLVLAISRIFYHTLLYRRPVLQLGVFMMIVGIQIVMTGIVAELIVYFDKKNRHL